ncbi:hypothetical protein [Extensimonas sp. H3M7-6]|uniref:hypothetical protein n=1 Tax=Extensimonas soli TaxID=3031322 RepID=UPI0023DCC17A|nr:hypothetical protein [Extensimonas sp. H3M7-6]MDF1482618.1 hypothetical protein [Extensimonas sp. H3M7-6]
MKNVQELWIMYNQCANLLAEQLGGTSGIVGEYGEYLALKNYGGKRLPASNKSADIEGPDGKLYQVKSRKLNLNGSLTTQLGIIRSWDFDVLVAMLFDAKGHLLKALEMPKDVARALAKLNKHQNGDVITTDQTFFNHPQSKDITSDIAKFTPLAEDIPSKKPDVIPAAPNHHAPMIKMQKAAALEIVNVKSRKGIHFSNVNEATPVWWLDIPSWEIESGKLEFITFVLHAPDERQLHVLEIPTAFLRENVKSLCFWPKKTGDFYSFVLSTDPKNKFTNIKPIDSRLDFSKFLKKSVPTP